MEILVGMGLHAWCPVALKKICSFVNKRKCARKIFIIFVTLSDLNKTSNRAVTHTYKMHENWSVLQYFKSDMHVRPMRFSISCNPADSSDKTNWCVLLYCCACLHPNTIIMETRWSTVPCPATHLSILICKSSARTKQSVIGISLKTNLEIRLGICIYQTSFLHRPNDYIGFTPSCPPHILQQNCTHASS